MMAEGLWDKECDFEEKSDEYFISAFGTDGIAVKEYLKKLSDLFNPDFHRAATTTADEEQAKKFALAQALITEFELTINRNLYDLAQSNLRKSWEYLSLHAMITKEYANALILRAKDAPNEELLPAIEKVCDLINLNEMKLHRVLDGFFYYHNVQWVASKKQ
jgi:hypothetical protein